MKREKFQEVKIEIIKLEQTDIVFASRPKDDGPVELPFVPAK